MPKLYNNDIINTKMKLSKDDIFQVEKQYKFTFPKEIFEHYMNYNGGRPFRNIFKDSNGYEYILNYFIPIKWKNENNKGNLETVLDMLRVDHIIPEWLIPFAYDPGGNMFCFSIKIEDKGAIYYWDHEYEYGEDPEDHIMYLAESINVFIESMTEEL